MNKLSIYTVSFFIAMSVSLFAQEEMLNNDRVQDIDTDATIERIRESVESAALEIEHVAVDLILDTVYYAVSLSDSFVSVLPSIDLGNINDINGIIERLVSIEKVYNDISTFDDLYEKVLYDRTKDILKGRFDLKDEISDINGRLNNEKAVRASLAKKKSKITEDMIELHRRDIVISQLQIELLYLDAFEEKLEVVVDKALRIREKVSHTSRKAGFIDRDVSITIELLRLSVKMEDIRQTIEHLSKMKPLADETHKLVVDMNRAVVDFGRTRTR